MVEVRHMGGALARREREDAVGVRRSGYFVFVLGVLFPEIAAAVPGAIASVCDALAPFATGESFVNLHGRPRSEEDRLRPWAPGTAERLRAVKERFDPQGTLRFGHWAARAS
jgi:hypothetical protein